MQKVWWIWLCIVQHCKNCAQVDVDSEARAAGAHAPSATSPPVSAVARTAISALQGLSYFSDEVCLGVTDVAAVGALEFVQDGHVGVLVQLEHEVDDVVVEMVDHESANPHGIPKDGVNPGLKSRRKFAGRARQLDLRKVGVRRILRIVCLRLVLLRSILGGK